MPELTDFLPTEQPPASSARGTIANTITSSDDELFVTVPSYDGGRQQWGPCQWVPSNAQPERGDDCLVIFDERETPWVLVLAPAVPPTALLVDDWNDAVGNGWYKSAPGVTHGPVSDYLLGMIVSHRAHPDATGDPWVTQEVWAFTDALPQRRWRRACLNGAWSVWLQVLPIPLPVVNGQWLKGVGGAVVWGTVP